MDVSGEKIRSKAQRTEREYNKITERNSLLSKRIELMRSENETLKATIIQLQVGQTLSFALSLSLSLLKREREREGGFGCMVADVCYFLFVIEHSI